MLSGVVDDLTYLCQAVRKARKQPEVDISNSFDLIKSLLAPDSTSDSQDDEDEDAVREISLILLRLQWAQASAHLESIEQEQELLQNAPPVEEGRVSTSESNDDITWKLDLPTQRLGADQQGPLLDSGGRVRSLIRWSVLNNSL